jgi:plastocyanin
MRRRIALLAATTAVMVAMPLTPLVDGSSAAAAPPAKVTAVQASFFKFCPASAPTCTPLDSGNTTVTVGTTVTWTYTDLECDVVLPCPGHNVVFKDVKGKTLKGQGRRLLSRKFTKPGTYAYVCTIHASFGMVGTVTVKPA